MPHVAKHIANFLGITSEKGVTAIEYGLLAALISMAIITAVTLVGTNMASLFTNVAGKLKTN